MEDLLCQFLTESKEALDVVDVELVQFERDPGDVRILNNVLRLVHTVKGTSGFLDLPRLETLAHACETLMGKFRDGAPVTPAAITLILQSIDRIRQNLVAIGESGKEPAGDDRDLIARLDAMSSACDGQAAVPDPGPRPRPHRALRLSGNGPEPAFRDPDAAGSRGSSAALPREPSRAMAAPAVKARPGKCADGAAARDGSRCNRMRPIGDTWQRLPRVVRDLGCRLGKTIELETTGGETELDRKLLDMIGGPLTHIVRNSADHGIEGTADRIRLGKPEAGTIRLSAHREDDRIVIRIADDGRGIDVERVAAKAIEKGLATAAEVETMSKNRIQQFVFEPGFSTAARVSSVSGRGIGMDVVRTNIEAAGGSVHVNSEEGAGTTVTIEFSLAPAAMPAQAAASDARDPTEDAGKGPGVAMLLFRAGSPKPKAVPLSQVARLGDIEVSAIETVDGRHVVQYRGATMPLIAVGERGGRKTEGRQPLLVLADEAAAMGLLVDDIVDIVEGAFEVAANPEIEGVLGSVVIEGRATDVIDVDHYLSRAFGGRVKREQSHVPADARQVLLVDDSAFFRDMVARTLRTAGYDVTAVSSAQDALAALGSGREFDVLVTDIEMPRMSGFELRQAVSADARHCRLPVIALSSSAATMAIARGGEAGFLDCVTKFDRERLIGCIKDAVAPVCVAA